MAAPTLTSNFVAAGRAPAAVGRIGLANVRARRLLSFLRELEGEGGVIVETDPLAARNPGPIGDAIDRRLVTSGGGWSYWIELTSTGKTMVEINKGRSNLQDVLFPRSAWQRSLAWLHRHGLPRLLFGSGVSLG